ncbi:MAG: S8 family serine peptidase, partial [Pseudomonadota bacterium]
MPLQKRTGALDGGLNELSIARNETDLLICENHDIEPESFTAQLERPALRRGAATRSIAPLPAARVTVKLIVAADAVAATVASLGDLGADIISQGPQVILADVPPDNLPALEAIAGLKRAEYSRRLQFRMDQARGAATRTDLALGQHPTIRGDNVVVGIVDSGVDWRHGDFHNADGTSRMEMFMHAVQQNGADTFTEFSNADIDRALNGIGNVPQGDLNGHGTHCASIATGNGSTLADARYRGVAPNATLMGVRTDTLHDTHTIEGIRRIFERSGDRPAVINLSLGGHIGAHDGTSALENVIAQESGAGRIIVAAAGNEGGDRIHFDGELVQGADLDIEFTIRDDLQFIDVWIPRDDEVNITIIDPNAIETEPDGSVQQTNAGAFRADLRVDQFNGDVNLFFAIAGNQLGRRWRIRLQAVSVQQGHVHAWGHTRNANFARNIFMTETSPRYSIGMPATEERAIAVGAWVSRAEIAPGGVTPPGLVTG